jgi:antitoxin component YwqK of YwqJK toxin-antitoxin module
MQSFKFLLLSAALLLMFSCQNTVKEVALKYPNGKPLKELVYEVENGKKALIKEVRYFPSGAKEIEGEYRNDKKHGKWTYWFENGTKWMIEHYKDDIKDGTNTVWAENGKLNYEGNFRNGTPDGEWIYYDESGKKIMKTIYQNGEKLKEEIQ